MPAISEITRIQNAVKDQRDGKPFDKDKLIDDLIEALLKMDSAIDNAHDRIRKLEKKS